MKYIEAPEPFETDLPSLFLAGGIGKCPDWQAEAAAMLEPYDVVVFNPRRKDFPVWDRRAEEIQVGWEFEAIQAADVTMFWFPSAFSMQPIALFELGGRLWSGAKLVVGRDPGYLRANNIDIQIGLLHPELKVHQSLADTVKAACALLGLN